MPTYPISPSLFPSLHPLLPAPLYIPHFSAPLPPLSLLNWELVESSPSEISRNEISRNVSRNFYFAFREIFKRLSRNFAKFRETKYMKISRNFAKVILLNCTETNVVSLLQLNSYRNLNLNSIFHYFCSRSRRRAEKVDKRM
jgi:hypothetical protein